VERYGKPDVLWLVADDDVAVVAGTRGPADLELSALSTAEVGATLLSIISPIVVLA
jgi:hypothetical protein